jgi:hypothetical protein
MTTIQDMVNDVRRRVYGTMTENVNLFQASASAGQTSLQLELGVDGIQRGMLLSSGLNVWFVKGVYAVDNTVFVIPGYNGSPQNAVSAGDMLYIRPRMTDWFAFNSINDAIRSLSSPSTGLYKVGTWVADVDPTYQTYEVPAEAADMVNLARVRYRWPGTPDVWADLAPRHYRWIYSADQNRVRLLISIPSGTEIEFTYKAPFTPATALTDDPVADCGLSDTMLDIPVLGAAIELLLTTESRRTQVQTQGDSRRPEEVPVSGNSAIASQLQREYRSRVQEEMTRLVTRLPIYRGL